MYDSYFWFDLQGWLVWVAQLKREQVAANRVEKTSLIWMFLLYLFFILMKNIPLFLPFFSSSFGDWDRRNFKKMAPSHWIYFFFSNLDWADLIKQVDHGLQSIPSSRSHRQSEPRSAGIASRSTMSAFTLVQTQNREDLAVIVMPGYSDVLIDVGKRLQCHLCNGKLLLLLHFEWMYHIYHIQHESNQIL